VQLPMLTKQVISTEPFRRNIPNPHLLLPTIMVATTSKREVMARSDLTRAVQKDFHLADSARVTVKARSDRP
jgi:hypothetical protein